MTRKIKLRCICKICRKLRIVQPLFKTTKEERNRMQAEYICSDCVTTN